MRHPDARPLGSRRQPGTSTPSKYGYDEAESLARVLALWGHQVRVVHDGRYGPGGRRLRTFDLALLDIGLPRIDGYRRRRNRRSGLYPGLVLAALTGYGQAEDRHRGQVDRLRPPPGRAGPPGRPRAAGQRPRVARRPAAQGPPGEAHRPGGLVPSGKPRSTQQGRGEPSRTAGGPSGRPGKRPRSGSTAAGRCLPSGESPGPNPSRRRHCAGQSPSPRISRPAIRPSIENALTSPMTSMADHPVLNRGRGSGDGKVARLVGLRINRKRGRQTCHPPGRMVASPLNKMPSIEEGTPRGGPRRGQFDRGELPLFQTAEAGRAVGGPSRASPLQPRKRS